MNECFGSGFLNQVEWRIGDKGSFFKLKKVMREKCVKRYPLEETDSGIRLCEVEEWVIHAQLRKAGMLCARYHDRKREDLSLKTRSGLMDDCEEH